MLARCLHAVRYRNYDTFDLELAPAITVLVGKNAQGKTNLIEALQLSTTGASFRRPSPIELVRLGDSSCRVELSLEDDDRVIDLGFVVEDGKRSFFRNGKKCAASGVRGELPSVLFCPDHLDMVKRSARLRRSALDDFGVQLNAQYAKLVSSYAHIVEQRNALLKEPYCSRDLMTAWNESLATTGAALLRHRCALLERIRVHLVEAYGAIAAGERADVAYRATIDSETFSATEAEGPDVQASLHNRFLTALDEVYEDEVRRGITLVGPHRDEISFTVDGREARAFASQGQQRSLVLAWKIAEVQVTCDILGHYPLLLLDDVMSELDSQRREAFLHFIEDGMQTVITTTNLGYFTDETLERAKVVRIGAEG